MRLIFWFLLALNVGMLVLRYGVGVPAMFHLKEPVQQSEDPALQSVEQVYLLGEEVELKPSPKPKLESRSAAVELDSEVEEQARPVVPQSEVKGEQGESCKSFGPFEVRSIADSFVSRLATLDVSSRVQSRSVSAGEGYWVYLEPFRNKKILRQTLLDLQQRGIDCYIIPRGKQADGISLGMFSQIGLANKRVLALKGMGYEVKTQKIERSYNELWVVLGYEEEQKVGSSVWKMLLKGKNHLKEEEYLCLDVDS